MHILEIHIPDCVVHPRPVGSEHKFLSAELQVYAVQPHVVEMLVKDGGDRVFAAEIPLDAIGDLLCAARAMEERIDRDAGR